MSKQWRAIFMFILLGLLDPMFEHVEAERGRISSDTFFGCTDLDYHKKLTHYTVQKDKETFTKSLTDGLLLGKCALFKSGEEVLLVDTAFSPGLIKLRRKGDTVEYWTIREAIK